MRLGFALPQAGALAGPDALATVAQRAEALGFDSLWAFERLLYPVAPQAPYPASADGELPEACKRVFDPLATLTFVAAHTQRVALGTSVLNLPFHSPVQFAQQLTTIDVLSGGRLRLGLGNGWSPDEYQAVGVPMGGVGKRADEYLEALLAIWTTNPCEYHGTHVELHKSVIDLRPVQQPHPPVYLAAYSPGAMRRVARLANGWNPAGIPIAGMGQMFGMIKDMAREFGRDPDALELVVRANVKLTATPLGADREPYSGSLEQLAEDVAATRALGADELFFDVQFTRDVTSADAMVARMTQLWDAAGQG